MYYDTGIPKFYNKKTLYYPSHGQSHPLTSFTAFWFCLVVFRARWDC